MRGPTQYSEWVNLFERFKQGSDDEGVLDQLELGTIDWTNGVAERLTRRLAEVFDSRLELLSNQLQRDLNLIQGREAVLVQALLSGRNKMRTLLRVANLPAFPEHVRHSFTDMLTQTANRIQDSLMKSAEKDRSGKLGNLIRHNAINRLEEQPLTEEIEPDLPTKPVQVEEMGGHKKRGIILP